MRRRMSVWTVHRKLHALIELANVRTRIPLAWVAASRQWLADAALGPEAELMGPPRRHGAGPCSIDG